MKGAWATIDAWLQEHSPRALASLQPGASPEAIDALERQIGRALPAELREYLAIHDGQPDIAMSAQAMHSCVVAGTTGIARGAAAMRVPGRSRSQAVP
jgi:cell wall assembly regulator SMI1